MASAIPGSVKRVILFALVLAWCLPSATLERLSLDDMIVQATAIVRGKITGSFTALSGPVIYTHYQLQVSETLKGSARSSVEFVVPGGIANNMRQSFAGAPRFGTGDELVFFLWTGRSGVMQVLGLTQGLFALAQDGATDPVATRSASHEVMLERGTGQQVKDQTLVMPLSQLRGRIAATLTAKGAK
jgi:hypothetical protein